MKAIGGILAAVIIGAIVMMFAGHMNSVPTLDESAKASWAQVQNQYQRRADLIPNLVATVKGYA
ncbi:MAG: LemA family protein, partial [Sulfuricurvum sp.]